MTSPGHCSGDHTGYHGNHADGHISAYRSLRPSRPLSPIELIDLTRSVFEFQADSRLNSVFKDAVAVNLTVLHALEAQSREQWTFMYDRWKDFEGRELASKDGNFPQEREKLNLEVCELAHWHNAVIVEEIGISEMTMKRLETAELAIPVMQKLTHSLTESERVEIQETLEALYAEWLLLRKLVLLVIRRVYGLTNNKAFFKRHQFELWDLVDARLED